VSAFPPEIHNRFAPLACGTEEEEGNTDFQEQGKELHVRKKILGKQGKQFGKSKSTCYVSAKEWSANKHVLDKAIKKNKRVSFSPDVKEDVNDRMLIDEEFDSLNQEYGPFQVGFMH